MGKDSGPYRRWPDLAREGRVPAWTQLRIPDVFHYTLVAETDDYLVVNKPAPLMIHPGQPGDPPTLWDHLHDLVAYERANGGQVSLINRLDRETSGLVLAAKHKEAARQLSATMEGRLVKKTYLALCHGWPKDEVFEVDGPIARLGEHEPFQVWLKRGVHPAGQASLTRFRLLRRFKGFSLIQAEPVTGRMHQIRVHLNHVGLPLVGDKLYGAMGERGFLTFLESGWTDEHEATLLWRRQALHAWKLELPWNDEILQWEAPAPPEFFSVPIRPSRTCPETIRENGGSPESEKPSIESAPESQKS